MKIDGDTGQRSVVARPFEQGRRQIGAGHRRTIARSAQGHDTGATTDVQYALPGRDAGETYQIWRHRTGQHFKRGETRPALAGGGFHLSNGIHSQDLDLARRATQSQRLDRLTVADKHAVHALRILHTIMTDFDQNLARVLSRVMPEFVSLERCARLSGGASQETYAVDITTRDGPRRLALRRAPGGAADTRDYGGPGLAIEARLMTLARAASVPAPEILHVLDRGDGLGDGFVMAWLPGETLGARIVKSEEFASVRQSLAYQCGEILARIHGIDVETHDLTQHLERLTPQAFVARQWHYYRELGTPQPMIDFTARWLLEHLPPDCPLTLVHNDFRNGNLMISPSMGVIGVLDWEVAHIGDPMRDLGWICTNSWRFGRSDLPVGGFGLRADLFAGYSVVSGRAVDAEHVRFWEIFGSFWWAVGSLIMAEHYRHGPDRTVERPAIGRRSSECQVDCVNLIMPGAVSLPSASPPGGDELPRDDELLISVRDFLREDVMAATSGRTQFMARVAANSLDILLRDMGLGPALRAAEHTRLLAIIGHQGAREALRWELVEALRDRSMPLDEPGLVDHLRATVIGELAIDQPSYSGFKTAMQGGVA